MQHIRDLTSSTVLGPNMRIKSLADLGQMVIFGMVSNIKRYTVIVESEQQHMTIICQTALIMQCL